MKEQALKVFIGVVVMAILGGLTWGLTTLFLPAILISMLVKKSNNDYR